MKKIAAILLAITLAFGFTACGENKPSPKPKPGGKTEEKVIDLSGQTTLSDTVLTANGLANGVQAYYTNNDRTAYVVENRNVKLTHALTGKKLVSGLISKSGAEYLFNTLDSYVVFNGKESYASNASSDARINTTKLGYYYYSTFVRDMGFGETVPLYLEKAYHTYSDRNYQQFRIIASSGSRYVTEFGFELKLNKSRVAKLEISDGGKVVSSLENGDYVYENLSYLGMDIAEAGVVGIIAAGQTTKVSVSVSKKYYVIRQYISLEGVSAGEEASFANRLYTDETHSFDGLKKAAKEEENPLTAENFAVTAKDGAAYSGYNHSTGAYEFRIDGQGFNESYFKAQQKKYFENVRLTGVTDDRTIFLSVKTNYPLEGAALVDETEALVPVPLQVGKNFGHEKEEPIYNPSDAIYGETILPLTIKAGKEYEFTVVNAYQKWGNFDLKQLSSIEYYISYYHLSTGVSETNCIAPYYSASAGGSFGYAWVLPDFRGCSADLWADVEKQTGDPQYNSVGTLYAPTDNYGLSMGNYQSSDIAYSGLTYADIDYSYLSDDGNYVYTMRHVEMPQNDESRTYYTIEFTFLRDTEIDNEAFSIIGFDGRKGRYEKSAYLDENGEHVEITNPKSKTGGEIYKLHEKGSYFAYYGLPSALNVPGAPNTNETGNFGCIVKDYKITVDGKESDTGLAFLNDYRTNPVFGDLNYGSLTLDSSVTFKKGDTIRVDLILLPFGTIGQNDCQNVINVYKDSVTDAAKITAAVGTVGGDTWIPTVVASGNTAEFTIKGGVSADDKSVNYAVKVQGFDKLGVPKIYEKVNGEWVSYNFATALGYDGYGVLCENEKLTYTFVFAQNAAGRTFKIVAE